MKVGQIEKNPILALSTSEKDIKKYERVTKTYGNVVPAIVGQSGDAYRILSGQARLEACAHNGIQEIPVTIAEISDEAEQMKLALLLSTMREESGSLSEGAFIDALVTQHGITRRELMSLLKKSKSWISKRQSMALKLSEEVKGMVKDGAICARTAEEIAKLPKEVQVAFACKVGRDGLNKTNVGRLVNLYTQGDAGDALRKAILQTPLSVLDADVATTRVPRQNGKRGIAERISGGAGFLIRLACELKGLLATADVQDLNMVREDLKSLRIAIVDLCVVLDGGVSPGKQTGGVAV
ncbi:MAG: hypothetical protein A2Y21_01585 [Clostridiales bacterium GWC2_40_7]|nr:MAG: hypothetical protein A2Y21_01585 [Clostridiales bacterium GWC2_40_7]